MGYGKIRRNKSRHARPGNPWKGVLIAVSGVCCVALVAGLVIWLPGCKEDGAATNATTSTTATTTTTTATTQYEPPVYHVSVDSVFVRAAATTDSEKIGSLFRDTEVEVVAIEGDWYHIRYKDLDGYVRNDCIELKSGVADTTTKGESTTTTTTTKKTTTTTGIKYTDRYIDEDGMLQFEAGDHYVQKNSYPDGDIPWYLLLVNDWNPMPKGYDETLTVVKASPSATTQPVDSRMKEDLEAMLEAGKAYNIGVQSAYRSASKQSDLYWRQVNNYKKYYSDPVVYQSKAGEVVKRPGFSEHNTGLAVDLYGSGNNSLTESFAKTKAYAWLMENCADYGFILRFPKGKEHITGVIYEAWHFRYVGSAEVAHEIMDNGLCLEEYLAQKGQ